MLDLNRISETHLKTAPYRWAAIDKLFSPADAAALAANFPRDYFKRVTDDGGEKVYEYEIRCMIRMGEHSISRSKKLNSAWRALADDFLSSNYRAAMSALTGLDLSAAALEVNVFHYPPGGSHGPHPDQKLKIVTHVVYFNESWNDDDGGCLMILRSSDAKDIATKVSPLVGNSAVLVRSDDSWHAVSRVAKSCRHSRRCVTATFYRPGSESSVWPRWDRVFFQACANRGQRLWAGLTRIGARDK